MSTDQGFFTELGYISEIHCYFVDGTIAKFAQTDPNAYQELIASIQHPSKIFSQRNILIRALDCVSAIHPSFVTRLDIIAGSLPDWPYLNNATDVRQVWRGDVEYRFAPARMREEREAAAQTPGQTQTGFVSLHLADKQELYWEVTMPSQQLPESRIDDYLSSIVDAGGLHAVRAGSGIMIVNSANIAEVRFYPGPPQLPSRAWQTQTMMF